MKTVEERRLMVLDLYIEWLNQFNGDEPESKYDRSMFTTTEDEQWRRFRISKVLHPGQELDEEIWVISAHDGDEGGPSIIHAYWENWNPNDPDEEWELKYMVQLFDTMASPIGFHGYESGSTRFMLDKGTSNG